MPPTSRQGVVGPTGCWAQFNPRRIYLVYKDIEIYFRIILHTEMVHVAEVILREWQWPV